MKRGKRLLFALEELSVREVVLFFLEICEIFRSADETSAERSIILRG